MLILTISRHKKLSKMQRHISNATGHIHDHTIDFNLVDDIGDVVFSLPAAADDDHEVLHISLESVRALIANVRKVYHSTLRICHEHNIRCLES